MCEMKNTGRPLVGRGRISLRIRPPWQAFFIVVQSLSLVRLFGTVWTAARQASCPSPSTHFPHIVFNPHSHLWEGCCYYHPHFTAVEEGTWRASMMGPRSQLAAAEPGLGWLCLYWKRDSFPSSRPSLSESSPSGSEESCLSLSTNIHPSCPLPPSLNGLLVGSTFLVRLGPHLQWGLGWGRSSLGSGPPSETTSEFMLLPVHSCPWGLRGGKPGVKGEDKMVKELRGKDSRLKWRISKSLSEPHHKEQQ